MYKDTKTPKDKAQSLSRKEIAARLGVNERTIKNWQAKGCPFVESTLYGLNASSSRPRYDLEEVKAWLAEQNRKEEK